MQIRGQLLTALYEPEAYCTVQTTCANQSWDENNKICSLRPNFSETNTATSLFGEPWKKHYNRLEPENGCVTQTSVRYFQMNSRVQSTLQYQTKTFFSFLFFFFINIDNTLMTQAKPLTSPLPKLGVHWAYTSSNSKRQQYDRSTWWQIDTVWHTIKRWVSNKGVGKDAEHNAKKKQKKNTPRFVCYHWAGTQLYGDCWNRSLTKTPQSGQRSSSNTQTHVCCSVVDIDTYAHR